MGRKHPEKTHLTAWILGGLCFGLIVAVVLHPSLSWTAPESRRNLSENYPTEVFTDDQLSKGAVILHVIGMFYMFLAISIACDEYFVPALEVLVDRLGIKPEIAGATFMAAGGSAPELFTSFIGTWVGSAVGFGTIVGSAVFNVLFVIGMCAIFSTEPLLLTKWPFFRDCAYYVISLLVLSVFFGINTDENSISAVEAAILLGLYVGYCLIMANNDLLKHVFTKYLMREQDDYNKHLQARDSVLKREGRKNHCYVKCSVVIQGMNRLKCTARKTQIQHDFGVFTDSLLDLEPLVNQLDVERRKAHCILTEKFPKFEESWFDTNVVQLDLQIARPDHTDELLEVFKPYTKLTEEHRQQWRTILGLEENQDILSVEIDQCDSRPILVQHNTANFRLGLLDGLRNGNFEKQIEFTIINLINGDVMETFRWFDTDNSGTITLDEFELVMQELVGGHLSAEDIEEGFKEIDQDNSLAIDMDEFRSWYLTHCKDTSRFARAELDNMKQYFHEVEVDETLGVVTPKGFQMLCQKLHVQESDTVWTREQMTGSADAYPSWEQYSTWCESHLRIENPAQHTSLSGFMWTIALSPIVLSLKILPDVSEEPAEHERLSVSVNEKRCSTSYAKPPVDAVPEVDGQNSSEPQALLNWYAKTSSVVAPASGVAVPPENCWERYRFLVTFVGSIMMIGVFSYLMVWWATVIGQVLGIPDAVMGLTFLAAGTSVPDLVTSVLVARRGQGDMAVSSSIGSNIFDVLIGLPLPWLIFAIIQKQNITVTADTLSISILILIFMLLLVLLTIIYNGWVMTKSLGYCMFVFYVLFVIQDLLRNAFI